MAARKNFYAVKRGKTTGLFTDWEDCRNSIEGFSGAVYKGFVTREEAEAYLGGERGKANAGAGKSNALRKKKSTQAQKTADAQALQDLPPQGTLLAYVDGSYDHSLKKYAFGCVFLLPDGSVYTEYGNGDNPESLKQRNVTGEMLGAMYAARFAITNGFSALEIRYDYEGIEKWVTGAWRSKNELTQKYAASMRQWSTQIALRFTKVAAHTNVRYNELADQMAKTGLREGKGVPRVMKLEEMEPYCEEEA